MNQPTIYWDPTATAQTSPVPMTDAEWQARVELAAAYRIFAHLGWTELIFNHITLRVPGPRRIFLINPFGLHYNEVCASNLVTVDIDGNPVRESNWPINRAGFVIHGAIHGAVENAHCVMHTHTTTGMAVASLAAGLSPTNFYSAQLHDNVAYHEFEGVTVELDERSRMLASIGSKRAVILRNHGLLTVGRTVDEAAWWYVTMERSCQAQLLAEAAGRTVPIDPHHAKATAELVGKHGTGHISFKPLFDVLMQEAPDFLR